MRVYDQFVSVLPSCTAHTSSGRLHDVVGHLEVIGDRRGHYGKVDRPARLNRIGLPVGSPP